MPTPCPRKRGRGAQACQLVQEAVPTGASSRGQTNEAADKNLMTKAAATIMTSYRRGPATGAVARGD